MNLLARARRRIARIVEGDDCSRQFVRRATGGPDTRKSRRTLARQFKAIEKHVVCAHQHAEALILAEEILTSEEPGPVVELGCFKGGSTAKLSLTCRQGSRELIVCDSFAGLPDPKATDRVHRCCSGRVKNYSEGDYLGNLDEVRANITRFGAIEVCRFVPGYFSATLPSLDVEPALIFMDVDLVESAREVLRYLWPRLRPGGKLFTHEVGVHTFVLGLLDADWWKTVLGCCPPVLFGAGFGFGPHAAQLGYFEKTAQPL